MFFANRASNQTIALQFERHAWSERGNQPFLLFGDQRYTYREANAIVNRHVSAYKRLGLTKGDTVALILDNRPAFLWLQPLIKYPQSSSGLIIIYTSILRIIHIKIYFFITVLIICISDG